MKKTSDLLVHPVGDSGRLRKRFARFPFSVYRDDPAWVPHLLSAREAAIDRAKGPFFAHGDAELFLAVRGGEVVGAISAQVDNQHELVHHDETGFFGYFECIDDVAVARLLFQQAEAWLRKRQVRKCRGPYSFWIYGEVGPGILIEGFDTPPHMAMAHHRRYYHRLIEECGYGKIMEVYAWRVTQQEMAPPQRFRNLVEAARANPRLKVRPFDSARSLEEMNLCVRLFNEFWKGNWGHVPFVEKERDAIIKELLAIADPRIMFFIEFDGEPVAYSFSFPDVNEVMKKLPNGRLFPLGWLTLMREMKKPRHGCRTMVGGLKPDVRKHQLGMALDVLMCAEIVERAFAAGYQEIELGWCLEHNPINGIARSSGARLAKRYGIYERSLDMTS